MLWYSNGTDNDDDDYDDIAIRYRLVDTKRILYFDLLTVLIFECHIRFLYYELLYKLECHRNKVLM